MSKRFTVPYYHSLFMLGLSRAPLLEVNHEGHSVARRNSWRNDLRGSGFSLFHTIEPLPENRHLYLIVAAVENEGFAAVEVLGSNLGERLNGSYWRTHSPHQLR